MDVKSVLNNMLANLDEDILSYLISIIEDMSIEEKKSFPVLREVISPYLIDSNFVNNESEADEICQKISVNFGGSGYSKGSVHTVDEAPLLLFAPVKMNDLEQLKAPKKTYGNAGVNESAFNSTSGSSSTEAIINYSPNSVYDSTNIPTTAKELRKQKKLNEQQQRMLSAETQARAMQAAEMAKARMAAIRASRTAGRQGLVGLSLDRVNLPHPSGTGDLLSEISLTLVPGRRYGLIGRNGAGKSTLLKALANYKFEGLMHLRILLVDQHVEGDDDCALQWLLRADVERTALLEQEAQLTSYLHENDSKALPPDLKNVNLELALSECFERMDAIGVPTAEQRARKILLGLGFSHDMMDKPTSELSGGWAMRAALGAAIFVKPTLLLLDEPTNHLDLHALVWLENWLINHFEGMVIVVSHDRYFLNNICTDILELRSLLAGQKKSSLEHFSGDYTMYECTLEERKVAQARARVAYEKEKEKLREFISREGKKYDNPSHQSQRRMKIKQLESLVEIEAVEEDADVVLRLPSPFCSFDPNDALIRIQDVSFSWSTDSSPLFTNVDCCISPSSRIVILGKNGCGKTTLLNVITGENECTSGRVIRHVGSRVTMLQQHHYKGEQLDPNLSPIDHLKTMTVGEGSALGTFEPGTRQEETCLRSYLSNYGLTGHRAVIPVRHLSGGQRMRVAMAVALVRRPDVLILDEPTNHLDGATSAALCEALSAFEGAIIAVSHDESFVNNLMRSGQNKESGLQRGEMWVLSKGKVQRYEGSFAEYKRAIRRKIDAGEVPEM